MDGGQGTHEVGHNLGLSAKAVWQIGKRHLEGGLERALFEAPRLGKSPVLDQNNGSGSAPWPAHRLHRPSALDGSTGDRRSTNWIRQRPRRVAEEASGADHRPGASDGACLAPPERGRSTQSLPESLKDVVRSPKNAQFSRGSIHCFAGMAGSSMETSNVLSQLPPPPWRSSPGQDKGPGWQTLTRRLMPADLLETTSTVRFGSIARCLPQPSGGRD